MQFVMLLRRRGRDQTVVHGTGELVQHCDVILGYVGVN